MVFDILSSSTVPMETLTHQSLKGLRILVVEDNFIAQLLFSSVLKIWDVSPDIAANGKMAVEMIERNRYDVVLMDIMMPELDGYQATSTIRSMGGDYFRELPIFAFTSTPDPESIRECYMTGSICKSPLDKEELYLKISSFLKPVVQSRHEQQVS